MVVVLMLMLTSSVLFVATIGSTGSSREVILGGT
jgi:hypothetical protein